MIGRFSKANATAVIMACPNQKTGFTNGRVGNWVPEVAFSPFNTFLSSTDVPALLLNQLNIILSHMICSIVLTCLTESSSYGLKDVQVGFQSCF